MATTGGQSPHDDDTDMEVPKLSQDKIKMMMKSDPKFITRLIGQLDKQMHSMTRQKQRRKAQVEADLAEIARIDAQIASHVQPELGRLTAAIKSKTTTRDELRKQLEVQTNNLQTMHLDAASLIQSVRARTTKLSRDTASQRLEEARGFSSKVPTTTLLRSSKPTAVTQK